MSRAIDPPEWANDLADTIAADVFAGCAAALEPIVSTVTLSALGAEALLRYRHPTVGDVSPEQVVSAARDAGVLFELTASLAATALAAVPGLVTVNVDPQDLTAWGAQAITELFPQSDRHRCCIEVTERDCDDEENLARVVAAVAAARISVAVDDFSTGTSTPARVRRLRPNFVKLDRSITRAGDAAISATVRTAGGATIIAEGVRTPGEAQALTALGVSYAQGSGFPHHQVALSSTDAGGVRHR